MTSDRAIHMRAACLATLILALTGCAQDPHSVAERQRFFEGIRGGANAYSQQRASQPAYQMPVPVYQNTYQAPQVQSPVRCATRRVGNTAYTDCY